MPEFFEAAEVHHQLDIKKLPWPAIIQFMFSINRALQLWIARKPEEFQMGLLAYSNVISIMAGILSKTVRLIRDESGLFVP